MASTASPAADPKASGIDRRLVYGGFGVLSGLAMGLLVWVFDLFAQVGLPVVIITVGLMAVEGMIGFLVAQGDRGKLDDLISFIVAFFIVP